MQLSLEQQEIVQNRGNLRIDAVAGAGKTTTLIEYAKARPKDAKILYLAFNRSVKEEAQKRFKREGLTNVRCETAHSLAWKKVIRAKKLEILPSWSSHDLSRALGLQGADPMHRFALAHYINQCFTWYCNQAGKKLDGDAFLRSIGDKRVREQILGMLDKVLSHTGRMLRAMNEGKMKITHDFYLKKYHLGNPHLNFDHILFDEGQDASMVMMNIFLQQKAEKIIVGDSDQQIYAWRHAVNSLEVADFPKKMLTASYRYGQEVADLAMSILSWKKHVQPCIPRRIEGKGIQNESKSRACLARTNLALISRAIEWVFSGPKIKKIFFEGGIGSYLRTEEGISLYDVLNLAVGKESAVRDRFVRQMGDFGSLEEFALQTGNSPLKTMIELVKTYKNDLPSILKHLKEKHVEPSQKHQAEMVFSTVHRCKGLEYDKIFLEADFMSEEAIKEAAKRGVEEPVYLNRLKEEINLLYVAITRTRGSVSIPTNYQVPGSIPSEMIQWRKSEAKLSRSA